MKGIALILSCCMLFLSTGSLIELHQFPQNDSEMACCIDNSSDCCAPDKDNHNSKEPCKGDHDCLPGCDCSCQFQITAITYSFLELSGVAVQSYHYGHYLNSYSFEYSGDFLQPPRFA